MQVLDTDTVPRRDRLSLTVETVTSAAGASSFTPRAGSGEVRLSMEVWQFDGLDVFDTECSAHHLRRSGPPKSDEAPALMLTYGLKGVGVHSQPGRQIAVRPSTFWATDLTQPYDHHIDDTRTLTAKVPYDLLAMPLDVVRPTLGHLHLSPLAPLFTHHVREVRRVADQLDGTTTRTVGSSTLTLARALLASVAPDSRVGREALEDVLLLRIKAFVREHLGDHRLDAQSIAAAHFVSVRHLYKVCSDGGVRLEQWIIEERLARAADDLSLSPRSDITVSEVAHRWGFTSAAHFATRFRRTYGVTPREWRELNQPQAT